MSAGDIIAIVGAVATAVISIINAWRSQARHDETQEQIKDLKKEVNK
jgi:hypothetical protein